MIFPEPICMMCGKRCDIVEMLKESYEFPFPAFHLWCYCPRCGIDTFHPSLGEEHMPEDTPTIGWSQFAINQHTPTSGNSFTPILSHDEVVTLVKICWKDRIPGQSETDLTRKVVVPLSPMYCGNFRTGYAELSPELPVRARIVQRQKGEDFYIETYVSPSECASKGIKLVRKPVKKVSVVLYAANVLIENGGTRSTDCEWEIVALLASENDGKEPMAPLTMARNYLQKPGGTFTDYSATEFAEAIYYHSTRRGIKVVEDGL